MKRMVVLGVARFRWKFMAKPQQQLLIYGHGHEAMILVLSSIRNQADSVLKKFDGVAVVEQRSLAWKCSVWGHIKHFTRPALDEVAALCPKCGGRTFNSAEGVFLS
jgi:hypothetical protein